MVASESTATAAGRRCHECGGTVVFRPAKGALVCQYCAHVEPIEVPASFVLAEHPLEAALATIPHGAAADLAQGGREVECKTCGARSVIDGQAGRCPFCDAPVVVELPASANQILPETVLPFGVDTADAGQAFARWIRSRWFAPRDLVKRAKARRLDGVYLPYWTYDSNTRTFYSGERGEDRTETETYTDSNGQTQTRTRTVTDWYPASGHVDLAFDDVLVCASSSLPERLVDRLEPWDLQALLPFDDRYLAGFTAERYAIDLGGGFDRAKTRMAPRIRRAVERDIGGQHQRISSMEVGYHDNKWKHLLLPLWISAFRYHDRVFHVIVNARTGEVAGERPWSWAKIALLVLAIAAAIAVIVVLVRR